MKSLFCIIALSLLCVVVSGQTRKPRTKTVSCPIINNGIADTTTVRCQLGKESITLGLSGAYQFAEGCKTVNIDFVTSTDGTKYFFVSDKQRCNGFRIKCPPPDEHTGRGSWKSRRCEP